MIKQDTHTQLVWVHIVQFLCASMHVRSRTHVQKHTRARKHVYIQSFRHFHIAVAYTSRDSLEFACFSSQAICVNTSSNLLFIKTKINWNDENRLMSDSLEYKYNLDAEFSFFCQFSLRNRWLFCFCAVEHIHVIHTQMHTRTK